VVMDAISPATITTAVTTRASVEPDLPIGVTSVPRGP
jgi:hypothetical protein